MKKRFIVILFVIALMMFDSAMIAWAAPEGETMGSYVLGEENVNTENAGETEENFGSIDTGGNGSSFVDDEGKNDNLEEDRQEEGIEDGDAQNGEKISDVSYVDSANDLDGDVYKAEQEAMSVWNGTVAKTFYGGSGTASDPYLISNGLELSYFQKTVNSGNSYEGQYVALTADIWLNETADYDSWSDTYGPTNCWTGISGFAGNFDGRSHTIYGLYMCGSDNTGFFTEINNDTKTVIQNLNFEKAYVYGQSCVGVIVGEAYYTEISHCCVSGRVAGNTNVGGLIGYSPEASQIINNVNFAAVSGEEYVGGIIGAYRNYYELVNSTYRGKHGTINDCINKGMIYGSGSYVGGIAGSVAYNVNGLACIRLGNENSVESTGHYVGGIFGKYSAYDFSNETSKKFEQCYNSADVSGNSVVGGIVGYIDIFENRVTLRDAYNSGRICGSDDVAGIVGFISKAGRCRLYVQFCHNVGSIIGETNTDNTACAIFGGERSIGTGGYLYVSRSYYLSESVPNSSNGISLTAEQMKESWNFEDFDFNNVWIMYKRYPIFLWQEEEEYYVGTLTNPVQTDTNGEVYIGIDNILYKVGKDVDIGKCAEIVLNSKGGIVYSIYNGIVSDIYASKDIMSITIKATTNPKEIIYQNGELNTYSFDLNIKIYNSVNAEYDFIPVKIINQLEEHLTNIKIEALDSDLNFGKDGFWIFANDVIQINEDLYQQIGCRGNVSYSYQVNINSKYSINTAVAFLALKITATTEFETITDDVQVSVGNLDYQTQQSEEKKRVSAHGKSGKSANASVKKNASSNVELGSYLNAYLNSQQIQICEEYIYAYAGTLMASTSSEHSTSDKIMDKVFGKLGIDKNLLTSGHKLVGTTNIQFEDIEVKFIVDMGSYNLGTSSTYAAFGNISYKIYKNGTFLRSGIGTITYTDVTTFVNDLKNIAESYIKSAYKKIWGNNADKIAIYLTEGTIIEALRNEGIIGEFADDVFKVISEPTKRYTEVCIECPVNVQVYDLEGVLCGVISNNVLDTSYHDVYMRVEDDKKYVYLSGNDYYLKLVGNDTGTMNYYINEYNSNGVLMRTISYNEVTLNDGITYYATMPDAGGYSSEIYELVDSSGNTINPAGSAKPGDINNDGSVDVFDLMMCLNHVAGKTKLEGAAFTAANVVKDDVVDLYDLMKILNHIAKGSAL